MLCMKKYVLLFVPFPVIKDKTVYVLDLAAKLDSTAEFVCKVHWGDIKFPPPFGRESLPEVHRPYRFYVKHV